MTVIEATSGPSVLANVVAAEIVLAAGGSKVTPEATRRIQGARVVECDAVVQDAVCVVVAIDVVISLSSREVLDSGIELDPEEFVECDSLVVCVVVVLDVDWEELPAEVEDCVLLVDLVK
ncbi:unnamed protein product [Umbelopsis vinacea]